MEEIETTLELIQLKDLICERVLLNALLKFSKRADSNVPRVSLSYKSLVNVNRDIKKFSYLDFEKAMNNLAKSFQILELYQVNKGYYRETKQ